VIFESETQLKEKIELFQIVMPKLIKACKVLASHHESLRSYLIYFIYIIYIFNIKYIIFNYLYNIISFI
jgi:hypothetical protein